VTTFFMLYRLRSAMPTAPRGAPFPRELTTDRLRLVAADAASLDPFELYEHCGEGAPDIDEVTRYLTWGPYGTVNEAFEFLERCESRFDEGEAAHYAVFVGGNEPESGAFAGMAGLTVEWDRRLATLGTWFRKRFWGRGYSGERARALMRVAFDRLDLDAVAVTCHAENGKSRRAIRRYVEAAGGREEGLLRNHTRYRDGVADAYRFTVTREEWAADGDTGEESNTDER
jgi:RimJ/RimL family protein N-acetyltransferase